jgi:hypothetical protein
VTLDYAKDDNQFTGTINKVTIDVQSAAAKAESQAPMPD